MEQANWFVMDGKRGFKGGKEVGTWVYHSRAIPTQPIGPEMDGSYLVLGC